MFSLKKLLFFSACITFSSPLYAQLTDVVVPNTVLKSEQELSATKVNDSFKNRVYKDIMNAWKPPFNSMGQVAIARILLDDDGKIQRLEIESKHQEMIISVDKAIRSQVPFEFPKDEIDSRIFKKLTISFVSK
ncbi:TonB C-terminal domain-containing protein [Acinetobacter modestus]|uniref:TonB C-terminal domain-containing protein n=1 Tax=Acinetobacter modestus TaxID=1776740 RepID=UPI001F4AA0C8|nr:TonB C-terminal domain-containing protein [Acinetobacter modestus]